MRATLLGVLLLAGVVGAQSKSDRAALPLPTGGTGGRSHAIQGFRAPSYDTNNVMKSQIFGDQAQVMPNGYVEITGMRVEFYRYENGYSNRTINMTVTTPKCVYHQEAKAAAGKEDVRIVREDMIITGKGFVWENQREVMQIMNDTKVVLKNARRDMKEGIAP